MPINNQNGYQNNGRGQRNYNQNGYRMELPDGYLKGGYFKEADGKTVLDKDYIIRYPKELVKLLTDEDDRGKKNKRTQIRKFYEYCLRIQSLLRRNDNVFAVVEAEFNRLQYHAEYAKSRDTVSGIFVEFITKNVKAVHNAEDMNAFVKHFEAVVAYMPKEKN